ncbi:MAG: hypothetical protein IJJ26_00425 [Victivallales bacterium]|nr:hypothetical protein [Victivallales bacterium]
MSDKNDKELNAVIRDLSQQPPFFAPEAYFFLLDSLAFAMGKHSRSRHEQIRAADLTRAAATLALNKYGPFAKMVWNRWGLSCTMDWGQIVFRLADKKVLALSSQDKIEDFENVFDFDDVLTRPFRAEPPYQDMPAIRF